MNTQTAICLTVILGLLGCTADATSEENSSKKSPDYLQVKTRVVNERLWIGPQPGKADFQTLQTGGIQQVINFRTPEEMKKLPFREAQELAARGIDYLEIPIGGGKYAYSPAQLTQLTDALRGDKNTLLHCASGQRASVIAVAYLITEVGMSVDEAVKHAKGWWPLALQDVLGQELSLSIRTSD